MEEEHIFHHGFVTELRGNNAVIRLFESAECDDCSIRSLCGASDEDRSQLEVPARDLEVGDEVTVDLSPGTGYKAIFWAYFFPFLLILGVLVIGSVLNWPDSVNGLLALIILVPYFLLLKRLRLFLRSQLDIKVFTP